MSGPNTDFDPVEVAALQPAQLAAARDDALAAIAAAASLDELKAVRLSHAGDRSPLALANREIGALPPQARKAAGVRVGAARQEVAQALERRYHELAAEQEARILADEAVDVTLPWDRDPVGARHPLTTIQERVADIFVAMSWEVAEGPEVEAAWLNFDALNLGPDHPARSMHDTLFVEPVDAGLVLRTHTSPVQARTMLTLEPPIYVVAPGRTYRADPLDATHAPVFHQVEGLAIDEGLTMAHLRGTLDHFVQALFGGSQASAAPGLDGGPIRLRTRLRASYFPFTEPSAELDISCFVCDGESVGNPDRPCRTCSSEGWIEWGGCGMVNPRVLTTCGIDPDRYSGFAFGMGLERALMFRSGVEDMRDMAEGDVRFPLAFGLDI